MGYELVRVQVQGRERPTVQVMADRADGALIGVADCEAISHALGAVLDVDDPFPGEWSLEVSSAGIDRPLARTKDWQRFAGHLAAVEMAVPEAGRRRWKGAIVSADDEAVTLAPEEGGEAVILPRASIRRAKLVLTDSLVAATAAPGPPPLNRPPRAPREGKPRRGPGRFARRDDPGGHEPPAPERN